MARTALTPEERAAALGETTRFAKAHSVAANQGQSTVPNANADVNLHFVAFVQASSAEDSGNAHRRIVELDGRRPGPIDHGPSTNFLEVCMGHVLDFVLRVLASLSITRTWRN